MEKWACALIVIEGIVKTRDRIKPRDLSRSQKGLRTLLAVFVTPSGLFRHR